MRAEHSASPVASFPHLAAVSVAPGALAADHPDTDLEAAWQRVVCALDCLDLSGNDFDTPAEIDLCAMLDQAERFIAATPAETPHGVAIQLWLALCHTIDGKEYDELIRHRQLDALSSDKSVDLNARYILAALQSLEAQS